MYHPDQRGFFPIIQMKIEEGLSDEDKAEFLSLSRLEEKVAWIHKLPRVSSDHGDNIFREIVRLDYGTKSREKSIQNREAGNAQFYVGNYKQAQILYSVAVFTAPAKSEDFSLALANRSACFQKMKATKLALADISLALEAGYPNVSTEAILTKPSMSINCSLG